MKINFAPVSACCSGPGRQCLGLLPLDRLVVSPLRAGGDFRCGGNARMPSTRYLDRDGGGGVDGAPSRWSVWGWSSVQISLRLCERGGKR